jgi:stress response protein SCP2
MADMSKKLEKPEIGATYAITDVNGNPVTTLRAGLAWDPATAQPDTKGGNGMWGRAKRKARELTRGEPKSDLDNHVAFLSGRDVVRLANGNNQFPWQRSATDLGPVRASKDSVGGVGFGLDEWTDVDLNDLSRAVDGFVVVASTFDKGNFSTARNVTGSLWSVLNAGTDQEQLIEVGTEFFPKIDDKNLNISIGGFGLRGPNGLWQFTQVKFQGHIQPADDVPTANTRVMAFISEHLDQLMNVR